MVIHTAGTTPLPVDEGVTITEATSTPWERVTAPEAIPAADTELIAGDPISTEVPIAVPTYAVTAMRVHGIIVTPAGVTIQMQRPGTGRSDPAGVAEAIQVVIVATVGLTQGVTATVPIIHIVAIHLQGPPTVLTGVLTDPVATGLTGVLAAGLLGAVPSEARATGLHEVAPIEARVAGLPAPAALSGVREAVAEVPEA
jgi:hypothetical protein